MRTLDVEGKGRRVNPTGPTGELKLIPVDEIDEINEINVEVELITPLIGGGVKAGVVDGKHWLRSSEIKAGMRFWWRVLFGREYATPESMWKEEGLLFGRPAKYQGDGGEQVGGVGIFAIEVATSEVSPALGAKGYAKPNAPESVAYFAAAMDPPKTLLEGKTLKEVGPTGKIKIVWNQGKNWNQGKKASSKIQVLKSLAAFLSYGGIGSRTRKGAGALAPLTVGDALSLEYYPIRGNQDLTKLKPESTPAACDPEPAQFFGGHGSFDLLSAPGSHRTLLNAWKEVRKATRSLSLRDSPLEPRLPLGLPLATKKGAKSSNANARLASPVWGGVCRVWPEWDPGGPKAQKVEASTIVIFLVGDPPSSGPVPIKNQDDLDMLRKCIKSTLLLQPFKLIWSVPHHD